MNGKTSPAQRVAAGPARRASPSTRPAPGDADLRPRPPLNQAGAGAWTTAECGMTRQWPLHGFLELGALPGAVPCARLHARQLLWEWGLAALTDSTEVVASELVANAVQASHATGQTTPVRLWLLSDKAQVLVLVWAPAAPARSDGHQRRDRKWRGLLLVEALSEQWDWYYPPDEEAGKYVWAQITNG